MCVLQLGGWPFLFVHFDEYAVVSCLGLNLHFPTTKKFVCLLAIGIPSFASACQVAHPFYWFVIFSLLTGNLDTVALLDESVADIFPSVACFFYSFNNIF